MTIVAVVGDTATTTTVALAAGWPADDEVVVVEADPSGGALAGWLDTPAQPSLATIVANVAPDGGNDHRSAMATVDAMAHRSSGLRFVPNAVRSRAAHRAVDEASASVLPALASTGSVVIVDAGSHRADLAVPPALNAAEVVVLVHRQASASPGAATVRIERLVETVEMLAQVDADLVLAVVGTTPFDPGEIGAFVDDSIPGAIRATSALADDPLSAATFAGRAGVSAKRLYRLPLLRDASQLAAMVCGFLDERGRATNRVESGRGTA